MKRAILVFVCFFLFGVSGVPPGTAEDNNDRRTPAYRSWLCLRILTEGTQEQRGVLADAKALGDRSYANREAAYKRLLELPVLPDGLLTSLVEDEDPEVRFYGKRLQAQRNIQARDELSFCLRYLSVEREQSLPRRRDILHLLFGLRGQLDIQHAFVDLVHASDGDWLRERLAEVDEAGEDGVTVLLLRAISFLEQEKGDESTWTEELAEWTTSGRAWSIRFEAANHLARWGDRRCLKALVDLFDQDEQHRNLVESLLQRVTGERVDPEMGADGVARVSEAWRDWLAAVGEEAMVRSILGSGAVHNRLLVALWSAGSFIEVDLEGKMVWEEEGENATSVFGCENGNRLIAAHDGEIEVREFNPAGELVWSYEPTADPVWVQRLPGDLTLIGYERSLETVNREKQVVRKLEIPDDRAWYCARWIPGDHYLVSFVGRDAVVELDAQGKEVWAYETDKRIRDAQRLPSGNTLVVELRGRVIEVSPDKRVVWQAPDEMDDVVSAVRLEDGTTRVISSTGMYEVDPFGRVQKVIDYEFSATPNGGCFY